MRSARSRGLRHEAARLWVEDAEGHDGAEALPCLKANDVKLVTTSSRVSGPPVQGTPGNALNNEPDP
jgi:hypothetical protein